MRNHSSHETLWVACGIQRQNFCSKLERFVYDYNVDKAFLSRCDELFAISTHPVAFTNKKIYDSAPLVLPLDLSD